MPTKPRASISTPKNTSNNRTICGALVVALLAACYALAWQHGQPYRLHSMQNEGVRVVKVTPTTRFAADASKLGLPTVFKGSLAHHWPAMKRWDASYISRRMGEQGFSGVYGNKRRVFGPYWDPSRPLASVCQPANVYDTDLNFSATELFQLSARVDASQRASKSSPAYVYYTGSLDSLGPWAWADVSPMDELVSLNPRHQSVNVWFGQQDVTAACHYDGYHNFFVQIRGTKRFYLLNPSSFGLPRVYPFLHPSTAQCYSSLQTLTADDGLLIVDLNPGDVLYLPPLWFHEVVAITESISVNAWTDDFVLSGPVQEIFDTPIPSHPACTSNQCTASQKFAARLALVSAAIETIDGRASKEYLHDIFTVRYRPLVDAKELVSLEPGCTDSSLTLIGLTCLSDQSEFVDAFRNTYLPYVKTVNVLWAPLRSEPSFQLWFGNWIEYLFATVVGSEKVAPALQLADCCLLRVR